MRTTTFRSPALTAWAGVVVVLTLGTACGKKSPAAPATTVTLSSTAALDGWVRNDGDAFAGGAGPGLGDLDEILPGLSFREFYSFALSSIPGSVTIESAVLRLYQAGAGAATYASLGNVIVDRVDLGAALDAADFSGGTLTPAIGTLSTNATIEYKTLDVTTAVLADRNAGRARSDFRLRFGIADGNNNGANNNVQFTDAEDSCCGVNRPPQLVVTYR